jgi:hypothetical protein
LSGRAAEDAGQGLQVGAPEAGVGSDDGARPSGWDYPQRQGGRHDRLGAHAGGEAGAIRKMQHRVYSGVVAEFEGGWLHRLSLADSDSLAKGGDAAVFCKVYDGSGGNAGDWKQAREMSRVNGLPREQNYWALRRVAKARAPSPSPVPVYDAAATALQQSLSDYNANPDPWTKAEVQRAEEGVHKAFIQEARRRPLPIGPGGFPALPRR